MIMKQLSSRLRRLTQDYMEACKAAADIGKIEEKAAGAEDVTAEDVKKKADLFAEKAREYSAFL
jgi:hypothetical protein